MTPDKIRHTIAKRARDLGVGEGAALGMADLLGFGKRYNQKGRMGIMGVPAEVVSDADKFFKDPSAQIDAGMVMLSKAKDETGSDFGALAQYTGSPETAMRAYLRGTKYTGEQLSPEELTTSFNQLGLKLNPMVEAQKAGIQLAAKRPMQQDPMQQEMMQEMQPAPIDHSQALEEELPMPMQSSPDQREQRLASVFGGTKTDAGLSPEFSAYIEGLV
jgi:hypothetical protein